VVAHGLGYAVLVENHELRGHLGHLFGHQAGDYNVFAARAERAGRDTITARWCGGLSSS
jgi:hypothetical protein